MSEANFGGSRARGNHEVIDYTDFGLGEINPFRYRSYYYDTETGLYYLKSRYYDPQTGRFISMDGINYLDPETIGGTNLYAYCNNNPVMYVDPTGHSAVVVGLIIGLIIGAGIGFGAAAYIDYSDDGEIFNGSVAWYDYLGAIITGGIIGGAIGAGIGYIAPAIPSILSSTGSYGLALANGGTATISITGARMLEIVGALVGVLLLAEIPMFGKPNSEIKIGGSYGRYDENGNLIFRTDTTGKSHFIKKLGKKFLPHTHYFDWNFIEGVWRYIETVLPF